MIVCIIAIGITLLGTGLYLESLRGRFLNLVCTDIIPDTANIAVTHEMLIVARVLEIIGIISIIAGLLVIF